MSVIDPRSDRELRKVKRNSLRTLKSLGELDVKKAAREGKTKALLAEGERARDDFQEAKKQLQAREVGGCPARRGSSRRRSRCDGQTAVTIATSLVGVGAASE